MAVTPWAVLADVTEITGKTVTQDQLDQAISVIELSTGRTQATALKLTTASREWLRRAVAYQAAWMLGQPDYFERMEVTGSSQDGASVTGASPSWLVLAPLAKAALRKLRWRGTRSVPVEPWIGNRVGYPSPHAVGVGPIFDDPEAPDNWRPL